jgi:hypothetical protein
MISSKSDPGSRDHTYQMQKNEKARGEEKVSK